MIEEWKTLDFNEDYGICNDGRIISFVRYETGKFLKPSLNQKGYLYVNLGRGSSNRYLVHRLVALTFIENKFQDKKIINHKNGIKIDNRSENLEWSNYSENNFHAYRTGLKRASPKFGLDHHASKFKAGEPEQIRKLKRDGLSVLEIAKKFNVCIHTIYRIIKNRTYKESK